MCRITFDKVSRSDFRVTCREANLSTQCHVHSHRMLPHTEAATDLPQFTQWVLSKCSPCHALNGKAKRDTRKHRLFLLSGGGAAGGRFWKPQTGVASAELETAGALGRFCSPTVVPSPTLLVC